ncbi:MAG: mechanosensitive ion channel domain-containing protein [Candidatus Nanoarchaeia archaeon]
MAFNMPTLFGELATNIITAVIILLLGFVAGKIIGNILGKVFASLSTGTKKKNIAFWKSLAHFISLCIYIIAVILALNKIGITSFVLKIILAILAIIVLGSIAFALLNFLMNLFFGLRILTYNKFEKGDRITIKKITGTVERIGLSSTRIRTADNEIFILTNRLFFKYKLSKEKNNPAEKK